MALPLTPLTSLPAADVDNSLQLITAHVREYYPEVELDDGALFFLVCAAHAQLSVQQQLNIDAYLSARSLYDILNTPNAVSPDFVDAILSNYNLTRRTGVAATGQLTIFLSDDVSVTIAKGAEFVANGRVYYAADTYSAKADSSQVIASNDRLIRAVRAGTWAFDIELVAALPGLEYTLKRDALILPRNPPANFITARVAADFSGGTNTETNDDLLRRMHEGIAAKAMSNRVNMSSAVRSLPQFSTIIAQSIIGYGDPEMLRDRHTLIPLTAGGRVDWYIRSSPELTRKSLVRQATYINEPTPGTGVWQLTVLRDDLPGFYRIESILAEDDTSYGTLSILSITYGTDTVGFADPPLLHDASESRFTAFQTAVVRFARTHTTVPLAGAVANYRCELVGLPLLAELQAYVSSRGVRNYGSDCLVKAPVPCFVHVTFTLRKPPDVDLQSQLPEIRAAVINYVSNTAFTGRLFASKMYDLIYPLLPARTSIASSTMFGEIHTPAGDVIRITSPLELVVPSQPSKMISPRTVQFYVSDSTILFDIRDEENL